jgi:uncharacterized coiled-coil DUF342 family protein
MEEQKQKLRDMADELDAQVASLAGNIDRLPREFQQAIARLEEAAMWIRKAIDKF